MVNWGNLIVLGILGAGGYYIYKKYAESEDNSLTNKIILPENGLDIIRSDIIVPAQTPPGPPGAKYQRPLTEEEKKFSTMPNLPQPTNREEMLGIIYGPPGLL